MKLSRQHLLILILYRRSKARVSMNVDINPNSYLMFLNYSEYQFMSMFRIPKESFRHLVKLLQSFDANIRMTERSLLMFLYRIAHGVGYRNVSAYFRVSHNCAWNSCKQVMELFVINQDRFIKLPDTNEWPQLSRDFHRKSPRVDVVGAIDGTFIKIRKPTLHSNHYYCRKMFFAVHMLAMCDWRGIFTYVQVGDPGNIHDSTAYLRSKLHADIVGGRWPLTVNGYKLLTDSAFPQTSFIIKTNSTNSHRNRTLDYYRFVKSNESGRTCIESIFGVMVNRFRIFGRKLDEKVETVPWLVMAACCVHNYLNMYEAGELD